MNGCCDNCLPVAHSDLDFATGRKVLVMAITGKMGKVGACSTLDKPANTVVSEFCSKTVNVEQ